MRIENIRSLSEVELQEELSKSQEALMNLRFSAAAKQLGNPNQLSDMRKQVARMRTVLSERRIVKESNA